MFKYICLFCFVSTTVVGQTEFPRNTKGSIEYSEDVELPHLSKGELHANLIAWMENYYKSSNVIQKDDDLDGILEAKYMFPVFSDEDKSKKAGFVYYQMEVNFRQASYSCRIFGLRHADHTDKVGSGGKLEGEEPYCGYRKLKEYAWDNIKKQADESVQQIIFDLKEGMSFVVEKAE